MAIAAKRILNADSSVTWAIHMDASAAAVMEATWLDKYPYQATTLDVSGRSIPNPVPQASWPLKCLMDYLEGFVQDHYYQKQQTAALTSAAASAPKLGTTTT